MMSAPPAPPLVSLPRVAQWTGGDLVVSALPADPAEREAFLRSGIHGASIDTRTLAPGDLFVPLPGSRADGHAFLARAFECGAAAALCARDRYGEWQGREPGPLCVVDDVTLALQRLAHRHRESWDGLLLGVTGSAGKTTTKDLVAAALATAAPTLRTEGNLNNHWGVPLTLMRLRPAHRAAVVEMGMNQPGEIAMLAALAEPAAAVITLAGTAHLERFGRPEAIAAEKASLGFALKGAGPVFAGADSPALLRALRGLEARLVTYGLAARADVRPQRVTSLGAEGSRVEIEGFPPFTLSLPGEHQVANALAAVAVAREYRLDPAAVAAAIESYRPTRGRMEPRRLHGSLVLVDSYNANPDSVLAALATLASMPAPRRIAILGDMLELGDAASRLHRDTGAAACGCELWSVGTFAADWAAGARRARVPSRTFAGIEEVRSALREALGPGVVVLVKASRGAALERVLEGLGEGP